MHTYVDTKIVLLVAFVDGIVLHWFSEACLLHLTAGHNLYKVAYVSPAAVIPCH